MAKKEDISGYNQQQLTKERNCVCENKKKNFETFFAPPRLILQLL